jgi:hypothetical protein
MPELTELDKITAEIEVRSGLQIQEFDGSFFSSRSAKFLDITSPNKKEGLVCIVNKDGFEYKLNYPAFITDLEFYGAKPLQRPKLKVEILPISGDPPTNVKTDSRKNVPNCIFADVRMIVRGFKISPDSWGILNKSEKITRVVAKGYTLSDLESLELDLSRNLDLSSRIEIEAMSLIDQTKSLVKDKAAHAADAAKSDQNIVDRLATVNSEIEVRKKADLDSRTAAIAVHEKAMALVSAQLEEKNDELTLLEEQREGKAEQVAHLEAKKQAIAAQLEEQKVKLDGDLQIDRDLVQRISEKSGELNLKTEQVTALKDRIRSLNNDVSLFADDMKGFAKQGDRQIKTYLCFVVAPCLLIAAILAGYAIYSTTELYANFIAKPDLGVWNLLALKIPFVIMLSTLLTFCFKATKPFVTSIREIHEKRLRLSEISILVRDASDAYPGGEDVTEQDRSRAHMEMRIQLIRDYLTGKFDQGRSLRIGEHGLTGIGTLAHPTLTQKKLLPVGSD